MQTAEDPTALTHLPGSKRGPVSQMPGECNTSKILGPWDGSFLEQGPGRRFSIAWGLFVDTGSG